MAQRKRTETSFEDSLQKLEAIVKRLEEEEIPLESSLKLFAEGQTLARACEEQLKTAENQIRQLLEKSSGEIEETDFSDASPAAASGSSPTESSDEEDEEENAEDASPSTPPNVNCAKGDKIQDSHDLRF